MRGRDIKTGFPVRFRTTNKIHSARFGYDENASSTFSKAARTHCGIRIGNSGYDQITPAQCEAVPRHSVEDRDEFCKNCVQPWHSTFRDHYLKPGGKK